MYNPLHHHTKYELYANYTQVLPNTFPPLLRSDVSSSQLISNSEFKSISPELWDVTVCRIFHQTIRADYKNHKCTRLKRKLSVIME